MTKRNILVTIFIFVVILGVLTWYMVKNDKTKSPYGQQNNQTNNQTIPGTNSGSSSATPLTSVEEIGLLTSVSNETAQLYENNNLGISLTVPKNWILDSIYDKNVIVFKSPADAATNYQQNRQQLQSQGIQEEEWIQNSQTLEIKYYKDFQTWYNSEDKVGPANCSTIKECYQQDGDFKVENVASINNYPAFSAVSIAGDVFTSSTVIEHNGIYIFGGDRGYIGSNRTVPYEPMKVLSTLKFLR